MTDAPAIRNTLAGAPLLRALPVGIVAALALTIASCGSSTTSAPTTTTTAPLTGLAATSPQNIVTQGCADTLPVKSVAVASVFAKPSLVNGLKSMSWIMSTAADHGVLQYLKLGTVQVIVAPNVTYLRAPATYWTSTPVGASAQSLANRWISIASSSSNAPIAAPFIPYSNLSATLANCLPEGQPMTKGAVTTVGTSKAIDVAVVANFTTQTLSVQTDGTPYVLRSIVVNAVVGKQTSLLTGFNHQKPVTIPFGATSLEAALAPQG